MSVTTEDVAEAVKQLWNANATLSDPSTGLVKSLIFGRVPDRSASPYAAFTVKDGPVALNSQTAYLQTFIVEIKTWTEAGAVNAGEIKAQVEAVFVIRPRTVLTLGSGRTLALLTSRKQPGEFTEDDKTQQAQSVKVSTDRFELFCQG